MARKKIIERKASELSATDRKRITKSTGCLGDVARKYRVPLEVIVAIRSGEPVPRGM